MNILARKKYLVVKHAPKRINLQSLLRDFNFATIYIDKDLDWASNEEIQGFKNNANAKIEEIDAAVVLKNVRRVP